MHESCHICMSHVTCEWAMPHMHESCHICMSHVTHTQVSSNTWDLSSNAWRYCSFMNMSLDLCICHAVHMSRIHVTSICDSTCAYTPFMRHICTRQVTCDVYMWLDLCLYVVYSTYMHTSSHTYTTYMHTYTRRICTSLVTCIRRLFTSYMQSRYEVATIRRLLQITGLYCRIVSFLALFCKRDL